MEYLRRLLSEDIACVFLEGVTDGIVKGVVI